MLGNAFQKYKIVFLILNYQAWWETIQCVESIFATIGQENISSSHHEIVVVDNGSKNESYIKIKERYKMYDAIHILKTEENLGFAKGNNVGFQYAKVKLSPAFIVMINSDIIMNDADFETKLFHGFLQYDFGVAGPNVVLKNGKKLNPMVSKCLTLKDAEEGKKHAEKKIRQCNLKIEPFFAAWARITSIRKYQKTKKNITEEYSSILNLTVGQQLHGCFLIFSSKYIDQFDGIYDKTFLYGEETLLRLRCERSGLKMCFLHDITAIHNESKTEKYIGGNVNRRHLKRYQNSYLSSNVIISYMKSKEEL